MHVPLHDSFAAGVAALAEFLEQAAGNSAALGLTLVQVGLVGFEDAGASAPPSDEEFVRVTASARRRTVSRASWKRGDRPQAEPLVEQYVDGRMLFSNSVSQPPRSSRSARRRRFEVRTLQDRRGEGCNGILLLLFAEHGSVLDDGLLDGFGEVHPDVPAVRDMDCVGGAEPSGLRIGCRTIAADQVDAGMVGKPPGHRRHCPVR
nr:hypothetical protein [Streptomyces sp. NBRC 13847]